MSRQARFLLSYQEHCGWVSGLDGEMERRWEIFGEHMNDVDVSYSEQRHRTREAREDKICSKLKSLPLISQDFAGGS